MLRFLTAFLALLLLTSPVLAGETLTYADGETTLEGYLARADSDDAPIVLIVHQWKGLGAYEKHRADMLAAEGYHAFAIDMYGKDIRPQTAEEAKAESSKYKDDPALARKRLQAALDYARTLTGVDESRVAIIGYCFGGTMALELARSGADIKGAVSFHGGLSTKAPVTEAGTLNASVMVHHGAADTFVPETEVKAFTDEMNAAQADWVFISYAGAVHAFTEKEAGNDPATGIAYNEKADLRSWKATQDFLDEIFRKTGVSPL